MRLSSRKKKGTNRLYRSMDDAKHGRDQIIGDTKKRRKINSELYRIHISKRTVRIPKPENSFRFKEK